MKSLIILLFLSLPLFALEDKQVLIHSISQHAITIGAGENKVYIFVDPLCPMSQTFIQEIFIRQDLQKISTYYIFLYQLPRFSSDFLISHIYQSKDPFYAFEDIILFEEYDITEEPIKQSTLKIIQDIKTVGKKMQITTSPYILSFDKASHYYRSSKGSAPSTQENVFD